MSDQTPMLPSKSAATRSTGLEPMLSGAVPAEAVPWLVPEAARRDPMKALELAGKWMPQELVEDLAKRHPMAGLRHVPDRLPTPVLVALAWWSPDTALHCASAYLPEPTLSELARRYPRVALYAAWARLSQPVFEELVELEPDEAFKWAHERLGRLPLATLEALARRAPGSALWGKLGDRFSQSLRWELQSLHSQQQREIERQIEADPESYK